MSLPDIRCHCLSAPCKSSLHLIDDGFTTLHLHLSYYHVLLLSQCRDASIIQKGQKKSEGMVVSTILTWSPTSRLYGLDYISVASILYLPRLVALVYAFIAGMILLAPWQNMETDGFDWFSLAVVGRAELRAYHFATALMLSYCCSDSDRLRALKVVALSMGTFALARFYGYAADGVDRDPLRAYGQQRLMPLGFEVLTSTVAVALIFALGDGGWKKLQSENHPARSHFSY